jgi:hypothetical protein
VVTNGHTELVIAPGKLRVFATTANGCELLDMPMDKRLADKIDEIEYAGDVCYADLIRFKVRFKNGYWFRFTNMDIDTLPQEALFLLASLDGPKPEHRWDSDFCVAIYHD